MMKKLYRTLDKINNRLLISSLVLLCLISFIALHPRFRNLWDSSHRSTQIALFIEETALTQAVDLEEYWQLRDTTSKSSLQYNPELLEPHSILKIATISATRSPLFTFASHDIVSRESLITPDEATAMLSELADERHNELLAQSDTMLLSYDQEKGAHSLISIHSFDQLRNMQGLIDFEGVSKVLNESNWLWLIETEFYLDRTK